MYTVLIADTDALARMHLARRLSDCGHCIVEVADGKQALELLRDHSVDLVFTEMSLPGLDGLTLAQRIRADLGKVHVPVIMVSAETGSEVRVRARTAGVNFWLPKPVNGDRAVELANWALRVGAEIKGAMDETQAAVNG